MNRAQRRAALRAGQIVNMPIDELVFPWKMTTEECRAMALWRLHNNLVMTGNPFHHLTANGVIVDPDPTLEYELGRLTKDEQESIRNRWLKRIAPDAPKAVPVNRKFYGTDPYERN